MLKNIKTIKWRSALVMVLAIVGVMSFGIFWLSAHPADPPNPQTEGDNPYFKVIPGVNICRDIANPTLCNPGNPASWPSGCGSCIGATYYCRDLGYNNPCNPGNPASWPSGCGACTRILPDLDSCPAGPGGARCYNNFGIEISCANPDQADWNLDLEGDICDPCGNQRIDTGEDCDSDNLGGLNCINLGFSGGTLACGSSCQFDTANCFYCGDNKVDIGEQCDLDNVAGKSCQNINYAWSDSGVCAGQIYDCRANAGPIGSCVIDTASCGANNNCQIARCDPSKPETWATDCGANRSCLGGLACYDRSDLSCRFDTSNCCGDGVIGFAEYCDGNESFPLSANTIIRNESKGNVNFRSFMISDQCLSCGPASGPVDNRCWPMTYRNCAKTSADDFLPTDPTKYIWIANSGKSSVTQMVALNEMVKLEDIWPGHAATAGICAGGNYYNNVACNTDTNITRRQPETCGVCNEIENSDYYPVGTIVHEYQICFDSNTGTRINLDLARGDTKCNLIDTNSDRYKIWPGNPSRTAVNVNSGESWVVYRAMGAEDYKECDPPPWPTNSPPPNPPNPRGSCGNEFDCGGTASTNYCNGVGQPGWFVGHFSETEGLIKICPLDTLTKATGYNGGGVAIDQNGDAWVGAGRDSQTTNNIIKLKGGADATAANGGCDPITGSNGQPTILENIINGVYGMAMSPSGGIWLVEHRSGPTNTNGRRLAYIQDPDNKSNPTSLLNPGITFSQMDGIYAANSFYGLATDKFGVAYTTEFGNPIGDHLTTKDQKVWRTLLPSGSNPPNPGVKELTLNPKELTEVTSAKHRRGVGIDVNGNIWVGRVAEDDQPGAIEKIVDDRSVEVLGEPWIPPGNTDPINQFYNPFGVSGDSDGYVWGVNYNLEKNSVCRTSMAGEGTQCFNSSSVYNWPMPYMYSDFLGMHRAMVFRTRSTYYPPLFDKNKIAVNPLEAFDLSADRPDISNEWNFAWGKVVYQASTPIGTEVQVYVCFGDSPSEVKENCSGQAGLVDSWIHDGNWILAGTSDGNGEAGTYNHDYNNSIFRKKFLRLRIELKSTIPNRDPVLINLKVGCKSSNGNFICD